MGNKILAIVVSLLIVSVSVNVYFVATQRQGIDLYLKNRIDELERANAYLSEELYRTNLSLQQAKTLLEVYRSEIVELRAQVNRTPAAGEAGSARLEAPAVMRKVVYRGNYPFYTREIIENGTMIQVSVDIKPGYGRVLVVTKPLMGVVFQDAANTAVVAAENYTGIDLSGSDVIFSVQAPLKIPEVDGPSAGALMTTLIIAALQNISLPDDITMTGTIDASGHVGEIGGVIEKAEAAKDAKKKIFILPRANSRMIKYEEEEERIGLITIIRTRPVIIDARDYIEKNIGIHVEYVDTIEDIMNIIRTHA